MVKKQLVILNKLGLHARAAARLVNVASRYLSEAQLTVGNKTINAKSIMSVMTLGASQGTKIDVTAHGKDEDKALQAICDLINKRFGEKE